ncbi:uncharacterized protein PG986_000749 [Apiospora aurea]|uniref:Uncharacterized protein n=1 Tax=Apiospora aurea TaxID=335848 RepID=A0ABR1QUV7_9PEZI
MSGTAPLTGPQSAAPAGDWPNGYTAIMVSREHSNNSLGCGPAHLMCALEFIVDFLQKKDISVVLMGGLALNFRGSPRATHDIEAIVHHDMGTLHRACIGEER